MVEPRFYRLNSLLIARQSVVADARSLFANESQAQVALSCTLEEKEYHVLLTIKYSITYSKIFDQLCFTQLTFIRRSGYYFGLAINNVSKYITNEQPGVPALVNTLY